MKGNKRYTIFIKNALSIGFTDEQADFLWQIYEESTRVC